ncbi:MAG: ribosome recycling factor [Glomeribacter sp. 1016415]|uniref:Ribosome-recycling factor n=1 Tax=Mycoavidus cysteinexigens TaxID=1553431 RepID=A0A2Z6EU82_9BURK|nr:ribosome recycling factor [Mycoavidus cysteinexigens]MCX8565341.1 ribosome recycling factor [Glomeribacter sp. 1016415]BBE09014.1 ribosome recycling factor [Mycoavidus cysteinexigens]GAM52259.1 ribosome recycling factor [bacterium endosymbiont of Mortierella elongata FMR23-6]GLR00319.1 ribosome-recycling factor [Mycoavidus cysteinexigens]
MSIAEVKKNIEHKMGRSIDSFKQELAKIRTGRAHTGLLEHIQVDYYGSYVPLSQVANLTLVDARTIGVQPWEKKMVSVVEKAIRESDLGLNPATHGELLRVPMPALTEERRRELTKVVKSEGETAKIVIRGLRRDAKEQLDKLVKDEGVPEDSGRRAQDDVQKLTDKFVAEIDELVQTKSSEIMKV